MILQYNVTDSSLFVDATKMYQFKAKDSKIIRDYTLCLGNILKDFAIINAKKKKKNRIKRKCNFFFPVNFNPGDTMNVLDIHKYLMKGA